MKGEYVMKALVRYEFLKILRRKSTLIVMAASLLVTAFLFGLPIMQYQTYNQDGIIKGFEGIVHEKKQYSELSVILTDEYITDIIREYQVLSANPDNVGYDGNEKFLIGDAYWDYVAPRENLLRVISSNYDDPGETNGYNNTLPEMDLTNGANFYQAREDKVEALLNAPSHVMSEEQKEYWKDLNSNVTTPLQYGYYGGWKIIISSFELLMFALLAVCIVIAPVFAGEYQSGTDTVILSGKYGKTKLITAKIVSSLIFGLSAFSLHILVACGLPLVAFGIDGWDLPLQIANTVIPYPFTFLQAVFINLGIIYLVLTAMIALTLLLSAKMKSPYLVLTVLVPVLFIPMFLSPNGTAGIYNLILFQMPYRATMPEIEKYISYQFGGAVLDLLSVRAIIYAVLSIILFPLAKMCFKRHQVSI